MEGKTSLLKCKQMETSARAYLSINKDPMHIMPALSVLAHQ